MPRNRRSRRWNARCPRLTRELVRIYGILEQPLPRHAGHGVHGRGRQALDAADPQRQAHRQGGAAHRGRSRKRGADHGSGGGRPRRSGSPRPAAASDDRPEGRAQDHRHRPAGLARRRLGRDRVQLGRGGERQEERPQGHPGAGRDEPRGHPRHARRGRHPDDPRRHDLARRRRRARHGQALRLGRRRRSGSTTARRPSASPA